MTSDVNNTRLAEIFFFIIIINPNPNPKKNITSSLNLVFIIQKSQSRRDPLFSAIIQNIVGKTLFVEPTMVCCNLTAVHSPVFMSM